MKTYVINLRESTERRQSAVAQLQRAKVDFEVFDACRGGAGYAAYFSGIDADAYLLATRRLPTNAEIGCYASHLALWKKCVAEGKPIVVLEDDFQLHDNFAAALSVVEQLISRLGFIRIQPIIKVPKSVSFRLRRSRHVASLHNFDVEYLTKVPTMLLGYAISPAVAARFIRYSQVLTAPVDKVVQRVWEHGQPMYALTPPAVSDAVHSLDSTIGDRSYKEPMCLLLRLRRIAWRASTVYYRTVFNRKQQAVLHEIHDFIDNLSRLSLKQGD